MSTKQSLQPEPEFPVKAPQSRGFKGFIIQSLRTIMNGLGLVVEKLESQPTAATVTVSNQPFKLLLSPVRRFLPPSLNQKLSDGILFAGIIAVFLLIFITKSSFTAKKPAAIVAETPPVIEQTQTPSPPTPETQLFPVDSEPFPDLVEVIPVPEELTPLVKSSEPESELTSTPPATVETPSETAELSNENLPQLTPEQYLMAAIQKQMNEATASYGNELVQSVRMKIPASLLQVTVNDDWYQLEARTQNQFAEEILKQAQNLSLTKLEITNIENQVIARSPVVGSEMIILKRS